ncbi:MAG TPA: hypothetical protein VFZ08_07540 [Terriglobia bacterium]|nr:hypothetical protein [Terriglobia bacterium]
MKQSEVAFKRSSNRRLFLKKGMLAAGGAAAGAGLLANGLPVFAGDHDGDGDDRLTRGDVAILRLLAAAEIIETDLWQQYSELGGTQDKEVSGVKGGNPLYMGALQILDGDMPQYVHDNTDDELSHALFLNAYLASKGAPGVNLDRFRILPSSKATGARQVKRLTNLTQLTVDTSWWVRYRSTTNPDFGSTFDQAVPSLNEGQHTAIPRTDADTAGSSPSDNLPGSISTHLQAIAFTAGFHFAFIEQAGTSLYHTLSQKVSSREVLRILVSIGGSEIMHFQTWQDKAGNALPLSDTDPVTKSTVTFVDLTKGQPDTLQANLIMPEPCEFINRELPPCAIIRPTGPGQIGAKGAIQGLIADGLFIGQTKEFIQLILHLAEEADEARREM